MRGRTLFQPANVVYSPRMAMFIQRKKFDHASLAYEVANSFKSFDLHMPGLVTAIAAVREIDGEHWVYVTTEGDLVEGNQFLLPEYDLVLATDS